MGKIKKAKAFNTFCSVMPIEFQTFLNIIGLVGVSAISYGLWTCLGELEKLRELNGNVATTIAQLTQGPDLPNGDLQSLFVAGEKVSSDGVVNNNNFQSQRSKRDTSKRARNLPDFIYDPFSNVDRQTQLDEYCWSLVQNQCSVSIPAEGIPRGPPGPPGPDGRKGEPGRPGFKGTIGTPGMPGTQGSKGEHGDKGKEGKVGLHGPRGPPGLPGVNGIPGSEGRRGRKGPAGPRGKPGTRGSRGPEGLKGEKGDKGELASTGEPSNCTCLGQKGEKGQRGLIGFSGYTGEKGEPGKKGDKGYGMQGWPGPKGEPGEKGDKGDRGYCSAACRGNGNVRRTPEPHARTYSEVPTTTPMPTTTTTTQSTTMSTIPPSLFPRDKVCRIKRIGKPVFVRQESAVYGSWMSDPVNPSKIWLTRGNHGNRLEEYNSIERFKSGVPTTRYNLKYNRFYGTQHAIYNGSFYYHFAGKPYVVRYDLSIPDVVSAAQVRRSHYNDSQYLYKYSKTYYDISADENGLWIIYSRLHSDDTCMNIMKLDLLTLIVEKVWRLPIENGYHSNGFIACGILYLVKDTREEQTTIDFTYDLYLDTVSEVNIEIGIPFKQNSFLTFFTNTYDRKKSALLAWDKGYILTYPMLF